MVLAKKQAEEEEEEEAREREERNWRRGGRLPGHRSQITPPRRALASLYYTARSTSRNPSERMPRVCFVDRATGARCTWTWLCVVYTYTLSLYCSRGFLNAFCNNTIHHQAARFASWLALLSPTGADSRYIHLLYALGFSHGKHICTELLFHTHVCMLILYAPLFPRAPYSIIVYSLSLLHAQIIIIYCTRALHSAVCYPSRTFVRRKSFSFERKKRENNIIFISFFNN